MNEPDQKPITIVGISDLQVGQAPMKIETNLGSCIAVCLYCIKSKVGGMLHLMMPHIDESAQTGNIRRAKYANTGVPELVRQLELKYHVDPRDLVAKIFGGGKVLSNVTTNIGEQNEAAARAALKELAIRITAEKTGGNKGYRISMDLDTGRVMCQKFGEQPEEF